MWASKPTEPGNAPECLQEGLEEFGVLHRRGERRHALHHLVPHHRLRHRLREPAADLPEQQQHW